MLGIDGSENIQISGLTFLNSPQFHLYLTDVHNLHVNGINVTVEVDKQKHIFDPWAKNPDLCDFFPSFLLLKVAEFYRLGLEHGWERNTSSWKVFE